MTSPVMIAGYLALFATVGFLFLFANLLVGKLFRPSDPHPEKLEVYECGEPTIGSSFVQFDLRFYVVALLFIIFDVEVAFFFPWAVVFGKAANLSDPAVPKVAGQLDPTAPATELLPVAADVHRELGIAFPEAPEVAGVLPPGVTAAEAAAAQLNAAASQLAWLSVGDILVFFGVLMVGFAYVWSRGDLDWVRAVSRERAREAARPEREPYEEPVLSA